MAINPNQTKRLSPRLMIKMSMCPPICMLPMCTKAAIKAQMVHQKGIVLFSPGRPDNGEQIAVNVQRQTHHPPAAPQQSFELRPF